MQNSGNKGIVSKQYFANKRKKTWKRNIDNGEYTSAMERREAPGKNVRFIVEVSWLMSFVNYHPFKEVCREVF